MGNWGVGVSQSDTYRETYERFMEEYDQGKPVSQITQDILADWLEEFDEDDGVLNDVYFALGKAEWMCGGVSVAVFDRIQRIVIDEKDISFWEELSATASDLTQRRKALNAFLKSISNPRQTIRKRKIPEDQYIAEPRPCSMPLPKVKDGDVFACKRDGLYRVFAIVRHQKVYGRTVVFCYLWKECFSTIPSIEELFSTHIMPLGYLNSDVFPKEEERNYVGNIKTLKKIGVVRSPEWIHEQWRFPVFSLAAPNAPLKEYPMEECLTLKDVLEKI